MSRFQVWGLALLCVGWAGGVVQAGAAAQLGQRQLAFPDAEGLHHLQCTRHRDDAALGRAREARGA